MASISVSEMPTRSSTSAMTASYTVAMPRDLCGDSTSTMFHTYISTEDRIAVTNRTDDAVVRVSDLRMRYGSKDVLDGVTFDINRGEVITLLGPNGAGKTTTIEILEGFRVRSDGVVSVLGVDPAAANEDWRAR